MKPFSEASERNKAPILDVLQKHLRVSTRVLEIGSGTGQHAALLKRRHPDARVLGMDSSPAMLDQARARPDADGIIGSK